jgi:type I restriction enzyme S subunit
MAETRSCSSSVKNLWQYKALGEVCVTSSGGTPLKLDSANYDGGTIPWLMSGEVGQRDVIAATKFITDKGLANSSAKLFPPSSVLVAMYGATAGEVGILRFKAATNQAVCGILPNENFVPEFLYYFLLAHQQELVSTATGNAQPNISQAKIRALQIPIMPRKEQERIVAILDEVSEGIATARANIETTCTKAIELLDIKLQTLLAPSADGWKSLTLAEIASDYGRGKSKHRPRNDPKLYGGVYPFVQTGDVRNANQYITTYSQTYNDLGLSQSKLWPRGTLCVTIAANIAETAILDFDACFPDSVIGVVANPSKANTRFIEYQLRLAKAQLQAKGKGSAQDNINLATFETHPFSFPSLSVQESLVERLDSMALLSESLTGVLQQKLLLLDELKQCILSQAFSGNI